jgi:hypothetical protein
VTISFTPSQKKALWLFTGLIALDALITSYGVVTGTITELNPLFAQFVHTPSLFISVMFLVKLYMVLAVFGSVLVFNRFDADTGLFHGGNIVAYGSATIMSGIMCGLLFLNIGVLGGYIAL